MKNLVFAFLVCLVACKDNNSQPGTKSGESNLKTIAENEETISPAVSGRCSDLYVFRKGTVIEFASYDENGKDQGNQVSTVLNVSGSGNSVNSEVEMKYNLGAAKNRVMVGKYSCDGNNLYVDIAALFAGTGMEGSTIEGDAIAFPINLSKGQSLPDVTYSFKMGAGGKEMKMNTTIRERKVESKETITIPGGKFECFKITSVMDANTEFPGMDDKMKEAMENMKKNMPKQKSVMYFDPAVGIVKFELYSGGKLISRSEMTSIKY